MKKDEAAKMRELLIKAGAEVVLKAGMGEFRDDGKLLHDEVDGVARWALRASLTERWPHRPEAPGVRFEAWFFQSKPKKDEEVLLLAIAPQVEFNSVFLDLIESGKFARRYKPLEAIIKRFYPEIAGVCRRAPLTKAIPFWEQLVEDAIKPIDAVVTSHGSPNLEQAPEDPLEALRRKFAQSP